MYGVVRREQCFIVRFCDSGRLCSESSGVKSILTAGYVYVVRGGKGEVAEEKSECNCRKGTKYGGRRKHRTKLHYSSLDRATIFPMSEVDIFCTMLERHGT